MLKSNKSYDYINPETHRTKDLSCRILLDGYSNGIDFHRNKQLKFFKNIFPLINLVDKIIFKK